MTTRKLTPTDAKLIKSRLDAGVSQREIARELGVDARTVNRFVRRAGLVANARVSRPVSRVDRATGHPRPTKAPKTRSRATGEPSHVESKCAKLGQEADELEALALTLKTLLANPNALPPADLSRLAGEFRAVLKQLGKAREAARTSYHAEMERAGERVMERLRAIVESQKNPLPAEPPSLPPDLWSADPPPAETSTPAKVSQR